MAIANFRRTKKLTQLSLRFQQGEKADMTDLRKAALDFLRLAIEDPKDHGHYAVDSNGEVYWYKEKPEAKHNEDRWMPGYGIPHKKQKIPHWDSLVFSAEEVASTPAEPPQPEIAPSPKMGPFNIERFKAGEFAYRSEERREGKEC